MGMLGPTGHPVYSPEQIEIPPGFPYLLKLFAKAAIRTQPYDLLRWTSAYFRALADGKIPPVKQRLEYPPLKISSGITPGYLKILLEQFRGLETVEIGVLLARWRGVDLPESSLFRILEIGDFLRRGFTPPLEFLAVGCGLLGNNLFETMIYVCELFTDEPEGGSAMIPLKRFIDLYTFLADLHCSDVPLPDDEGKKKEEDECDSSVDRDFPDPSKVALPGSRDELSEDSTENSEPCGLAPESSSGSDSSKSREGNATATTCGPQSDSSRSSGSAKLPSRTSIPRNENEAEDEAENKARGNAEDAFENYSHYGEAGGGEEAEADVAADMENYEPIGLENYLEGICECLEPAAEESSDPKPAPDPVEEFLERMRREFPSGLSREILVPGIGRRVPEEPVTAVCLWLTDCARRQAGLVGPRNIRHFLCPPLELSSMYEEAEETLYKCHFSDKRGCF